MAEFLTRDLKLAISDLPEPTYNTMWTGLVSYGGYSSKSSFTGMLTTNRGFYIPDKDKFDDTGKIGTGREFATEQHSGYVNAPSLEISEEMNIDVAATLMRRCMGGTDTVTAITTGAAFPGETTEAAVGGYRHTFGFQSNSSAAGRQLPSSTIVWSLLGASAANTAGTSDYIWGGVVVDSFKIDQQRSNVPTFTATLVGSGKNTNVNTLAGFSPGLYTGLTNVKFPTPTVQRYMLGAETLCAFNDGSARVLSASAAQKLRNFSLTISNNNKTDDRRPGDPRITSSTPRSGHYINRLLHGDRQVTGEVTIVLDDDSAGFIAVNNAAYNDTILTSFQYTMQGNLLVSNAVYQFSHTSGTATITVNSVASGNIVFASGMTALELQRILEETSSVGYGNVSVVKVSSSPNVFNITFIGALAGQAVTLTSSGSVWSSSSTTTGGVTSTLDNQGIFEVNMPKTYFRTVRGSDDNGDAVVTFTLFPVDDLVNGPLTVRIVDTDQAPIV